MSSASNFIELYLSRGLTPIPLERGGKIPILKDWPNLPREELLRTFEYLEKPNVGIRIEPPLFVIDVDDRRLVPLILEEIPSSTWMVETRRGIHVYLKAPEGHYPNTNKKSRLIQLLGEKCQVVAPPSAVDGHVYEFQVDPSKTEIAELSPEKVKLIERIIEGFAKHEQLILKLAEIWTEGHRHNLSLWLNGALRKSGIEKLEALVIVKSICLLADDRELKDRLTALKTTYEKPIEEIAGWSYLRRELEAIVGPEHANEILKLLPRRREDECGEGESHAPPVFTEEELREAERLLEDPLIVEKIVRCVQEEHGVVGDERAILESFFTMLSALTREPLNMHPSGRAGTGKSFIVLRCARLFPENMIFIKSGMTRKSLYYSRWAEEEGPDIRRVELWGKIIICLEAENSREFISEIKPNLSHDVVEYSYDFVEEERGKRITKTVKIVGWPSWIFISTRPWTNEEEKRRFNIMTPEADAEKYRRVIMRKAEDKAEPWKNRNTNMTRIIKAAIYLLSQDSEKLGYAAPHAKKWAERFPKRAESMTRFEHFLMLSQAIALLFNRQLEKEKHGNLEYVIIPEWIHEAAYELMKPTIQGLEKDLILFAKRVAEDSRAEVEGLTYQDLMSIYRHTFGETISRTTLRERYVEPLLEIGFFEKDESQRAHRFRVSGGLLIPELEEKPILSLFRPKKLADLADSENKPEQGRIVEKEPSPSLLEL